MRHITKAVVPTMILAFLTASPVLAGDYITDIVQALQRAPVYVAPYTEGTDNDTAGKLQTRLNSNDNIVLVMLPSTAEVEFGVDIYTIASRLSEQLENQRIVGLAVGNKVVGYAPNLPVGVAADQMRRAQSVSNDPITALGTFAQNVHLWQKEHPQPTSSPMPTPTPTAVPTPDPEILQRNKIRVSMSIGVVFIVVFASIILLSLIKIVINVRRGRKSRRNNTLEF